MSNSFLRLTLGSLSVKIWRFQDEKYPRILPDSKTERSAYGTLTGYGLAYEDPHLWTVNALVSKAEAETLQRIYGKQQALKRQKQDPSILLDDTTWIFSEDPPRTRALVAGTTEEIDGDGTKYFARYYAWITSPPQFQASGADIKVSFGMEEAEEKVDP